MNDEQIQRRAEEILEATKAHAFRDEPKISIIAAALREAREEAIEACAKVADAEAELQSDFASLAADPDTSQCFAGCSLAADDIALEIRILKDNQKDAKA